MTEGKLKYKTYYTEFIAKIKTEISALEARLAKAEEIGADNPDHKFYKAYLEVKEEWNKNNDLLAEYSRKLELLKYL